MSVKSDKGKKRDKSKGAESKRVALCSHRLVDAVVAGAEIYAESVFAVFAPIKHQCTLKLPKLKN